MPTPLCRATRRGQVRLIVMDDRIGANELHPAMVSELEGHIFSWNGPCVVVGVGDAFSIGVPKAPGSKVDAGRVEALLSSIRSWPYPCVMAVNGAVVGWGLALMLTGRIAVGTEGAYLNAGTRMGVDTSFVRSLLKPLESIVGPQRARFLIYAGTSISAEVALEWRLLDRVTTPSALVDDAILAARSL